MPIYQIRVRNAAGAVARTVDLDVPDDGAAITEMSLHDWAPAGRGLELWRGDRCLVVGYVADAALEPAEAVN